MAVRQLSSSSDPMYVSSVLRTLTAPLSQLHAFRLEWSGVMPLALLLPDDVEGQLVPSSSKVQGSTSISGSWGGSTALLLLEMLVGTQL